MLNTKHKQIIRQRKPSYYNVKNMSIEERAYVAGVIDGEGCFAITRRNTLYATPSIHITNTDEQLIKFLNSVILDKKAYKKRNTKKNKPVFNLGINGRENIKLFLEQIKPFLRTENKLIRAQELMTLCLRHPDLRG